MTDARMTLPFTVAAGTLTSLSDILLPRAAGPDPKNRILLIALTEFNRRSVCIRRTILK
jgi:hypothetical protein